MDPLLKRLKPICFSFLFSAAVVGLLMMVALRDGIPNTHLHFAKEVGEFSFRLMLYSGTCAALSALITALVLQLMRTWGAFGPFAACTFGLFTVPVAVFIIMGKVFPARSAEAGMMATGFSLVTAFAVILLCSLPGTFIAFKHRNRAT